MSCLFGQGRLKEALASVRRAREVSAKNPLFPRGLISRFEREIEHQISLEPQLAAYTRGERKPRNAQELALLLALCWIKQQFLGAAQLYTHAFAAPQLAENVTHEYRYDAARYASHAAVGLGDAAKLDDKERARWRKQALDWLRADLAGWRKLWKSGTDDDRALTRERLRWWQEDPKLAILREPKEIAKLPADEQNACRQLWADVKALLARATKD
jgi:hypothetical protein